MAEVTAARSAANAAPGSALDALTTAYSDLAAKFNDLLVKLDEDSGVGDSDYEAEIGEADTVVLSP